MLAVLAAAAVFCAAAQDLRTLRADIFAVHHAPGDEATARMTADILLDMREDFAERLPAGADPIHVVIAPTTDAFRPYAGHYRAEMVAGVARPDQGFIALKHPALLGAGTSYGQVVRHELMHVLLARNTREGNVPRWFNEGICMLAAGQYRIAGTIMLARMHVTKQIFPYAALDMMFAAPGTEQEFNEAYAQALSMTMYLHGRLGDEAFWALVRSLDARSFREALDEALGLTAFEFWEAWRRSLWKTALIAALVSGLGMFPLMSLLAVAAYFAKRRQMQRVLRIMEEEEAAGDAPLTFDAWDNEVEGYEYYWEEEDDDPW